MKIAIVGAGPVGLMTAILLHDKLSKSKITIYEKRHKFTREQSLVIRQHIFRTFPKKLQSIIIKSNRVCFYNFPSRDKHGYCFTQPAKYGNIVIKINDLQSILLKYVKQLKRAEIIYDEFTLNNLDKFDILIGADGVRSYIREKIMKTSLIKDPYFLSYTIILQYPDKNYAKFMKKSPISISKELFDNRQNRRRFFRRRDGTSYLALQLSPDEWSKNKGAKSYKELSREFKKKIKMHMDSLKSKPDNLDLIEIILLDVELRYAKKFAKKIKGKQIFLVGDSTGDVHFFTGFGANAGISQAKILSRLLHDSKNPTKSYSEQIQRLSYRKIRDSRSVHLPYQLITNICNNLSKKELIEIAKDTNAYFPNFSKRELCLLLSSELIDIFMYRSKI